MSAPTVILIHGSWHGGWCWDKVVPLLQAQQCNVVVANLPGHDANDLVITPPTLEDYTQHIIQQIKNLPDNVYLVGHSMAGIVLSEVAEHIPGRIKGLIYIAAFILQNGQNLLDVAKYNHSTIVDAFTFSPEYLEIDPHKVSSIFYNQCDEDTVKTIIPLLKPEPMLPLTTSICITQSNYGSIRKSYIICMNDKACLPEFQQQMCLWHPDTFIIKMDSDHSPFFSQPKKLTEHLMHLMQ